MFKFKFLVLTVLSLGLFLSLTSSANTTPTASPEVSVSVHRTDAYGSVAEMDADANAELVSAAIGDLLSAAAGALTEVDIARHLTDAKWDVASMTVDDVKYVFEVLPNGEVLRICIIDAEIEVDDGADSPILVLVRSRLEV